MIHLVSNQIRSFHSSQPRKRPTPPRRTFALPSRPSREPIKGPGRAGPTPLTGARRPSGGGLRDESLRFLPWMSEGLSVPPRLRFQRRDADPYFPASARLYILPQGFTLPSVGELSRRNRR